MDSYLLVLLQSKKDFQLDDSHGNTQTQISSRFVLINLQYFCWYW